MLRIDTHQHFWKYSAEEYRWIGEGMEALRRDFLPAHLRPLLHAHSMAGSVAVQARQSLEETRWLLELADDNAWILGVVGWVDLAGARVGRELERFAVHPKLRGIRHVLQDEPDDRHMLRADFMRGLALLKDFDLTYDLLLYPRHLPAACELVERFPEQRFALDHLAKPLIKAHQLEPWATDVHRLAAHPNVCCKISGMVTEADWRNWKQDDFAPYLDVALEAFGAERLMVGSDWPVCTLAAHYGDTLTLPQAYFSRLAIEQQEAIWDSNARRFYRLAQAWRPAA